jgi:acyl dehydratase
VPADTGRRYARVSGDRNPIHTSRLVARVFGFPGRIAHGMWTAARCLAALEGRLPDTYTMDVRFHRPVPVPGRVTFTSAAGPGGWRISVHDPRSGRPHLSGEIG